MIPGWSRLVGRADVLVIDTETTGLGPEAEAVEVAVLDTAGRVRLHAYALPEGPIAAEAAAVHGLSREALAERGARPWPAVHGELEEALRGASLALAWNAPFDERILRQTADRHGLALPPVPWRCCMDEHAAGGRWQKLVRVAARCGLPTEGAHGALADARMTLGVLRHHSRGGLVEQARQALAGARQPPALFR